MIEIAEKILAIDAEYPDSEGVHADMIVDADDWHELVDMAKQAVATFTERNA